jgi:hypothetical protein
MSNEPGKRPAATADSRRPLWRKSHLNGPEAAR